MKLQRQGALMAAPAAAVLAGVAVLPVFAAAWLSLHRSIVIFHEQRFIGLANFRFLVQDARFWSAVGHTAYFTAVAIAVELLLGLPVALLLHRGRGLLRAAVLLPWAIPTAVSARMWAWLFNADYGLLHRLAPGVDWLGSPSTALHAAILVDVWKTTPFVALILLAGLQSLPPEPFEAARIDAASAWRTFRYITLPMLRPVMVVCIVIRAIDAFRTFDIVWTISGGGPARATELFSLYAYVESFQFLNLGRGSAAAVIGAVIIVIFALLLYRLLNRFVEVSK